jgi:[histone H3]-lysine9 N-trimethyltransferase SUV39H
MKKRAWGDFKSTRQADGKIRSQFVRGLTKIQGAKPVKLVNIRDSSTPLLSFKFVKDYNYGNGVEAPDPASMEGCKSCRPNMGGFCGCEYTKLCECLEFSRVDDRKLNEEEKERLRSHLEEGESSMGLPKRFPYHKGSGFLVNFYLEANYPIYECNPNCACGPVCKSRVVQNGRQIGLEIFRTKNRGWGKFQSLQHIKGYVTNRIRTTHN